MGLTLSDCEFSFIALKYSEADMLFAFALKIQVSSLSYIL